MHMYMHVHMPMHMHMQAEVESAKQARADLDRAHADTRGVGRDLERDLPGRCDLERDLERDLEAQGALLEFLAELGAAAEARASDGGVAELQPKQYAALIHELDPSRTQEQTQQVVEWGFGVVAPAGELRDDLAIAPAAFVANFCRTAGAIEAGGGAPQTQECAAGGEASDRTDHAIGRRATT